MRQHRSFATLCVPCLLRASSHNHLYTAVPVYHTIYLILISICIYVGRLQSHQTLGYQGDRVLAHSLESVYSDCVEDARLMYLSSVYVQNQLCVYRVHFVFNINVCKL